MGEDGDAIRRLEARISALEREVGELRARAWLNAGPRTAPAPTRPASPDVAVPMRSPIPPPAREPVAPRPFKTLKAQPPRATIDLEQWFGQRGLPIVGVVALVAAGGYFLKYAFDRGWIAPELRVAGALAGGAAVWLLGERLAGRGMRRYGAALIGGGGGLAYLGLWAAAGLYGLIPRDIGSPLLAALTALIAWRAAHHRAEVLAGLAIVGALLAPMFLPSEHPGLTLLLVYLQVVGAGAAQLALLTGWSSAFTLALFGYYLLPIALAADHLDAPMAAWHALLGGAGAILVTRRRHWPSLRLVGLIGAWGLLLIIAGLGRGEHLNVYTPGAAALLALVAWAVDRRDSFAVAPMPDWPRVHSDLAVVLSPLLFCAVVTLTPVVPAAPMMATLGALYLVSGWAPKGAMLVALGAVLFAIAIGEQWNDAVVTLGWTGLALAAVLADRRMPQPGLRPVAIALAWLAGLHLTMRLGSLPWPSNTAFVESWALTLYACIAASAVAAWLWRQAAAGDRDGTSLVDADALWTLAALLLFSGVSVSIDRYFAAQLFSGALLAGRLALSLWWLVFAAAAVVTGFAINRREVRTIGLVVAGIAAMKVGLYDLSMLEALYRVAALVGLALVALAVGYLYSRRARAAAQPG